MEKIRRRMRAVRLAQQVGVESACVELGCSRASLYRWLAAFEAKGIAGLVEGSRRPGRLSSKVPAWVDIVIVGIRLHTYWNSKRIAAEMSRRQIYKVSAGHIDRLFQSFGCSRGTAPRRPGPRYERARPNQLWHIDIKGPLFIKLPEGHLKAWVVGIVDDYSRFLVGVRILNETKAAPILVWLEECFDLCGQPLELMTDNGNPFVAWMPGVLTLFGRRLQELHIQHLRTQVNSPWTNGKIEAFWNILQAELIDRERFTSLPTAEAALERFAEIYNYHRLSGTLGWLTPGERYDGTPFADRGFENIPALAHLQTWLDTLLTAA